MPLVVLLCGVLVLYPIGFLINESLNVGDPSTFPPEQYGFDNYTNLIDDAHILGNTALVASDLVQLPTQIRRPERESRANGAP